MPRGRKEHPIGPSGLRTFAFHAHRNRKCRSLAGRLHPGRGLRTATARTPTQALRRLAPQRAARLWLAEALAAVELPEVVVGAMAGRGPDYRCLAVERSSRAGRWSVLFRQRYRGIAVFGSLITVELTRSNGLLSIHGAVGEPLNVDPVARLSAAEVYRQLRRYAGLGRRRLSRAPSQVFYFDALEKSWRLVYLFRDVPELAQDDEHAPAGWDYFLDAHHGDVVAKLPRTAAFTETATDDLGQLRTIGVDDVASGGFKLLDRDLRVETRDFRFQSIHLTNKGNEIRRSAQGTWDPLAVSAHANAAEVARFFQSLGSIGRDGSGEIFCQAINCVLLPNSQEWANSAWFKDRAVYGQVLVNNQLHSYALNPDIVAHELVHGIISARPRLSVAGESGALNESYCDIFAVAVYNIENQQVPDPRNWEWVVGVDGNFTGDEARDLSDPTATGQPAHMNDYLDLPLNALNDFGGVHANSAIHSHAVHRLLTAEDGNGNLVIDTGTGLRILFETLIHQLRRNAEFVDSRRAIELLAMSEFSTDALRTAALAAIGAAFDSVGITSA